MLLITSCTSFLWKYAFIYLRYILRCGITDSIILCLSFWRTAKLFWKVATQIYTPMSNVQELHFFYFLTNTLEKAMAPHSSTLAWTIPGTAEPGGLQSMRLRKVGHHWTTSLSLSLSLSPILAIIWLFNSSCHNKFKVVSHFGFDCISLWNISMCLLTIVYLWRNCYSNFLSYLKSSCLFFTDLKLLYIHYIRTFTFCLPLLLLLFLLIYNVMLVSSI